MKTTLDIPDSIYREFKIKTAVNGETMRNATLSFIIAYNHCGGNPLSATEVIDPTPNEAAERLPAWAGIAQKFITRYPDKPLDSEAMRDEIVAARRRGLV